jgi:hypothetical protein
MILSIEYGIIRKKFPFGYSERRGCYRTFRVNITIDNLNVLEAVKRPDLPHLVVPKFVRERLLV